MNKKAKNYQSSIIDNLLNEISPKEQKQTERKMLLATRIDLAMKERGMKKGQLAKALGKNPSEISKWLSGTHNFTTETLWEIGDILGVSFINLEKEKQDQVIYVANTFVSQQVDNSTLPSSPKGIFDQAFKNLTVCASSEL
ncbi:MAG: helix-turn-helix transcriptional regulator [Bacteroidales bacterium]|nr:helix-turn-helix transcriptional regulator [Bacteroidales bacterium]